LLIGNMRVTRLITRPKDNIFFIIFFYLASSIYNATVPYKDYFFLYYVLNEILSSLLIDNYLNEMGLSHLIKK
jgi:hypothetical protein